MKGTEKAFGIVKSIILMHERFDALDERIKRVDNDLTDLSRSHADLAQEVAELRGYFRGRTDQAAIQKRLPEE